MKMSVGLRAYHFSVMRAISISQIEYNDGMVRTHIDPFSDGFLPSIRKYIAELISKSNNTTIPAEKITILSLTLLAEEKEDVDE